MAKRGLMLLTILCIVFSFMVTAENIEVSEEELYEGIGEAQITQEAGLTPDDTFYFLETFVEDVLVGDNPETALRYKEEKIKEVQEMVRAGKTQEAREALARAEKYSQIVEEEVSPELERRVRESSKAVKDIFDDLEEELGEEGLGELKEDLEEHKEREDTLARAAKVSSKIKELCEELSRLDPLEYSRVCKTEDDSPDWRKRMHEDLSEEQREEAEAFFGIMSECFQNPAECRCDDISIKAFSEQCSIIAPLAAKCEAGDDQACEEMENVEDPIDLLPEYLQDVMDAVEDKYGESKHDLHVPRECVEANALGREECMKVMFKEHAPEECQRALEEGKINPTNEREARKQCEAIMFESEAPEECIEAGIKDHKECGEFMFKLDAPQECLDAGIDGSGRNDWKECDLIRFKLDAPQECIDAGITGEGRDDWKKCDAIRFRLEADPACLDEGLDGTGRDDWKKCNKITFMLDAPEECHKFANERDPWKKCQPLQFEMDAPQECLDAGLDGTGRNDWKECDKIRFELEAPEECHHLADERDPWKECDEIRTDFEHQDEDQGANWQECDEDELHICENGWCECVDEDEFDDNEEYNDQYDDSNEYEESECKDGCHQECGDQNSDCVNNMCVCLGYEEDDHPSDDDHDFESDYEDNDDYHEEDYSDESFDEEDHSESYEEEESEEHEESNDEPEEKEEEPEDDNDDSGNEITGGVVMDNGFLDYFWN